MGEKQGAFCDEEVLFGWREWEKMAAWRFERAEQQRAPVGNNSSIIIITIGSTAQEGEEEKKK